VLTRTAHFLTSRALLAIARRGCSETALPSLDAIVAVVFAAFYIEAAANELLHAVITEQADLTDSPALIQLRVAAKAAELEDRNTRLIMKLQVMFGALRNEVLDKGKQPYQDLDLLLSLRNAVVHNRPETMKLAPPQSGDPVLRQEELGALHERLISRGIAPRPGPSKLASLLDGMARREVAIWAVNAALAVVQELHDALPSDWWRQRFFPDSDFTRVAP
jgi:hypothetical protein